MPQTRKGTPGLVLFPARNYTFEESDSEVKIALPLQGLFSDLVPKEDLESFPKDWEDFSLVDKEDGKTALYLFEIPRLLFAKALYPKLESNQVFNIYALEYNDTHLVVYGKVLTMTA